MQFARYLREFLTAKGVTVINHLNDSDIDIILHINPFPFLTRKTSGYSFFDAYLYKLKHPKTVIIARINECDERKGTHYMNKLLIKETNYSDFVVFIGSWLKSLIKISRPSSVVLNGADARIFNTEGKSWWDGKEKLKIVTHHWSQHSNKGHTIYQQLDKLLNDPKFSEIFEFTYIGASEHQLPCRNARLIPPLSGKALGDELRKHHIYITGSLNEPGGMHHIEGALSGLPILYVNSGALPEYCAGYGLEITVENLAEKLLEIRNRYSEFIQKLKSYRNTGEKMANEYFALFENLYAKREKFILRRKSWLYRLWLKFYAFFYDIYFRLCMKFK